MTNWWKNDGLGPVTHLWNLCFWSLKLCQIRVPRDLSQERTLKPGTQQVWLITTWLLIITGKVSTNYH